MKECTTKEEIRKIRSRKQACKSRKNLRIREEAHKVNLKAILEFFNSDKRDKIAERFDDATFSDEDFRHLCQQ